MARIVRRERGLLSVALLLAAGCGGRDPATTAAPAPPPVDVSVEPAAETLWEAGLEVSASVHPSRRAMPGTVLMGRVEKVLRQQGDVVAAGAVLARVEGREVNARLAQAEAGVAAARAMEHNALLMRERMERLHARQAASTRSVDDTVAAHDAAVAQREAAEQAVATARMYVSYADVVSPFAGVVAERRVEAGDTAAPGMPLFVIEDLAQVKVEAEVPESAALTLFPGTDVEVDLPAIGPTPWHGKVDAVLPSADAHSRTFTVRVIVDNPRRQLRSGMYARMRLPGVERRNVTAPATAVVRQGPLSGVFVVGQDGVARIRWVTLGQTREDRVAVLSGLSAGETLVVAPPATLADGMRVQVL